MWKKFLLTILISSLASVGFAAVEDPSTFTVGGTNSATISTSSTRMTHTSLYDTADAYGYKDYGAGNFGEFDIDATVYCGGQQSASRVGYFALSNESASNMGDMNTANDGIMFGFKRDGTDGWFLIERTNNNESIVAGSAYQTRYITITRSGSTVTANVYTDSGRTTHASGSPITVTADTTTRQYLYMAASGGSDGWATSSGSGYIENLEIVDAGGGSTPTVKATQPTTFSGNITLRGVTIQ